MLKLLLFLNFNFILAMNNQNKYFRFSYLQDNFFRYYSTKNIFDFECNTAQFVATSDYNLLYTFNLNTQNITQIFKGEMFYDANNEDMNCFFFQKPIDNINELCIQEIDNNFHYFIYTNRNREFFSCLVKNEDYIDKCHDTILKYNTTPLIKNNCKYNLYPNKSIVI